MLATMAVCHFRFTQILLRWVALAVSLSDVRMPLPCSPDVLMPATPENIREATEWVWQHVTAFGTTDLMTPLTGALSLLAGAPPSVPLVFLITDGCVENEREICEVVKKQHAVSLAPGGCCAPASWCHRS
jgi:hypothetical protein